MNLRRIKITAPIAHFKIPYGSKNQYTYTIPPPSTINGMLRVLFGEEINDYIFGYTFEFSAIFNDGFTLYKHHKELKENKKGLTSDYCIREYLYDCKLYIYTDIKKDLFFKTTLTMGRSNCLARLHMNFSPIKLINKTGICKNQFSPKEIGSGQIYSVTTNSKFNHLIKSFDSKVKLLRLNKQFKYDKYHDEEREQNIFLWSFKDGEIYAK